MKCDLLHGWYLKSHRDLDFRKTKDPYAIWISEVMLQQTRMNAMLEKYRSFMKRFPNVKSLADASEEEVIIQWKGLGYYSRARNLHAAAMKIRDDYGGHFPADISKALSLPGVGPYTAAAVLSICYDTAEAAFDGNQRRVLSRLLGNKPDRTLISYARDWIQNCPSPGDHNQALMELGAVVCVPGIPDCKNCPLRKECVAFQTGGPDYASAFPAKKKELKIDVELKILFLIEMNRIWIVRSSSSPFLKNTWFFPFEYLDKGQSITTGGLEILMDSMETRLQVGSFRHQITKYKIVSRVESIQIRKTKEKPSLPDVEWALVSREEAERRIASSMGKKVFRLLGIYSSQRDG